MQRSRLKNIANKSKEMMKPVVGEFEQFKNSLPIEIDDNYRLEAAWKAYGKPKNYQEALWEGLVQPIDDKTFKMPSIGYNEETEEYEYLNKGKENETVNKDIRVWDNDVIPFVKELKHGGYIRVYNDEKDCWTYKKGGQLKKKHWKKPENWNNEKISYEEWVKDVNPNYLNENYDLKTAYESEMPKEELERWKWAVNSNDPEYYMKYQDEDGKYIYHLGSIAPLKNGDYIFLKKGTEETNPELHFETDDYWNGKNGLINTHDLIYEGDRYYYKQKNPSAFKQGGQMNVIPEGALHARKNNMEGAGEDFTHKGIPVVDNDGEQQAEIERNEVIFNKDLTDFIESNYKKFKSEETKNSEKDEIAIKVGKRLVKELLTNTDDRTGLISEVEQKM